MVLYIIMKFGLIDKLIYKVEYKIKKNYLHIVTSIIPLMRKLRSE